MNGLSTSLSKIFFLVIKNCSSVQYKICWIRSYCARTKSVAKSFRICGYIKYYSFITSENVSAFRINNINWQCILYVLNNNFFRTFPYIFPLWRITMPEDWLFSGFQSYFWFLLYRVVQKNKRKGTEVNETLLFGLNELYSIFYHFIHYKVFRKRIFIFQFVFRKC
jgi:hypothetical protein